MSLRVLKQGILIGVCSLALGMHLSMHLSLHLESVESVVSAKSIQMPVKGGKFPHAQAGKQGLKGHRDLSCAECHLIGSQPPYTVSGKPSPNVAPITTTAFPGHASCVECHNFALMSFAKPAFCGVCHERNAESPTQPGVFERFQTARTASDFGIGFSHVAHRQSLPNGLVLASSTDRPPSLAKAQLRSGNTPLCTDCHLQLQTSFAQFNPSAPEMATETGHLACFTCHLEKPVAFKPQTDKPFPARHDCQGCHSLSDAGKEKQRAPGLFQRFKVAEFRHLDHELDTRSVKKSEARVVKAGDYLCSECHSAVVKATQLNDIQVPGVNSCTACHNEKRKPGLPEPLSAAVLRTLRNTN